MRFGAARGWAGAGAAFYRHHVARARDAFETREHVEKSSHVGWLFLYPDDVARLAVAREFRGEFFLWKGIELFQKYNRGAVVFSFLTLGLEFMADFPGADQDAVGLADLHVRDYVQETLAGKVRDRRRRIGMAQHALGREHDQRLAPVAQAPGGAADENIVRRSRAA